MVWRGTELADLQEEERATSPPATNNRKGSQRVQSIMMERLRRRVLSPWNEYSLPLTAPSFTRLATSEQFSGGVERLSTMYHR